MAVCAVGFLAFGRSGLDGGAGDQLAGFRVGLRGEGLDGDLVAEALEAADVAAPVRVKSNETQGSAAY
jgi:hypothetical protein